MGALEREVVLVPVDYSDESRRALAVGCEAVSDSGVLHVTHVISSPTVGIVSSSASSQERAKSDLARLEQFLADAGVDGSFRLHILEGDPGHAIVQLADALQADLIVMPSHGRTGIAHVLIGSVAERVVRLAHCPVLVLRTKHVHDSPHAKP
jgi:nucleotide-binding universal stress UspA family protein